ncbi:MAG: hypothetical protein A2Y70_05085 [Candidatus Aminicenantes bacterium RBG_13_64_14]|nr:MAG: hypothetical protein A2Y70_05085 [Candidatus Aminicenantes bacterium RBG_13_64_14]
MAVLFLHLQGGTVGKLGEIIPRAVGDWHAAGDDAVYDRQTLYDYMDGGAEVYLAFDFREVFSRKYAGPAGAELSLDVFDMGSPAEAFGIFSCDRADPPAGIGQDSEYGFGLLRFRQGRYFVTVGVSNEDEAAADAVLGLGRTVAGLLGPPGPGPDLLELLPAADLRPDRTSFFHSAVNLNNRYFIAAENILGLDRSADCVFAEYGPAPAEPVRLLLVRYPDGARAGAALRSFLASYLPEAGPDGLTRTENGTWVSALLRGNVLSIVFEAPSPDLARDLQASVKTPSK